MAKEVIKDVFWTKRATAAFIKIIEYLQEKWTEREIDNFIEKTEQSLSLLKQYPEMSRPSAKRKNIRIFMLDKHTKLIYRHKPLKRQIEVMDFWNMKRDPSKFKY